MRKITVGLLVVVAMLGVFSSPANAEKPPQIERSVTFPDINACTGELDMITLTWTITLHENRRNFVATFKTVIETESGFSGTGTETEVVTGDKQLNTVNIRMTDGDQVAMVKGHRQINLTTGEVDNNFRNYCVRS